ncbi:hypothetical protein IFM89_010831 [Coptis chinensis]|uniref:Exonuclease domain-containing protein n=1 Tax=Coptis chinensis TaxID=261450 RepID=A0A835I124_9MAGN|nr:hypothetical protein IFM89_010831 [Coptis chinensis]
MQSVAMKSKYFGTEWYAARRLVELSSNMTKPPSLNLLRRQTQPRKLFHISSSTFSTHHSSSSPTLSSTAKATPLKRTCLYHAQGKCTMMDDAAHLEKFSHDILEEVHGNTTGRFKHTCLYYTQGKCTMLDDPIHLEKFNHDLSEGLQVDADKLEKLKSQNFDYFLVLDLEGKVEILEFPVVMVDAKTLCAVDIFHRFVKPDRMAEQKMNEYIEGKYGKMGVDRLWHDTAIPFKEVLHEFEDWITQNRLWEKELGGSLLRAAFVTWVDLRSSILHFTYSQIRQSHDRQLYCLMTQITSLSVVSGNWDLKTKIPQQCKVSGVKLPSYFMEWINLKDIYLNFYSRRAPGMRTMMNELGISLLGSHHLGIDDSKNIVRVMQHMLCDGAIMQVTAKRRLGSHENVEFLFTNRIR